MILIKNIIANKKKLVIGIAILAIIIALLVAAINVYFYFDARNQVASEKNALLSHRNLMNSFMNSDNSMEFHVNFGGAYYNLNRQLVLLIAPYDNSNFLNIDNGDTNTLSSNASSPNLLSDTIAIGSSNFRNQTEEFQNAAQELFSLTNAANANGIRFQKSLFSYSYLVNLMNTFNDDYFSNYSNPDSIWYYITGFTLHDNLNSISIEILNIDDSKIERFTSEISDSNAVLFRNSRASVTSEGLKAGMRANMGSVGFRARMNDTGYLGFVTAGHNARTGTTVYRWVRVGVCIISVVDSRLDGAFIRTDNEIGEIYNTTHTGRPLTDINIFPLVGSTVLKEGRATGLTLGALISGNATHRYTLHRGQVEIRRKNLIVADYHSAANDSGGVVFDLNGHVLGIHIAGPASGQAGDRLVENVTDIQNVLNVTFY